MPMAVCRTPFSTIFWSSRVDRLKCVAHKCSSLALYQHLKQDANMRACRRAKAYQQYRVLTIVWVICQLYYPVVSAKQLPRNSSNLYMKPQKLDACTKSPLTEDKLGESASLSFQSNLLQRLAQHSHCLCGEIARVIHTLIETADW